MVEAADKLLDRALSAEDRIVRRQAFLELLRSDDWRRALDPETIASQGHRSGDTLYPDWRGLGEAAAIIASCEDRVQRALELAGKRFSGDLLIALAREMRSSLVEHALPHLRTAEGVRATVLLYMLQEAEPGWVRRPEATAVIRRQLREADLGRLSLMLWLAAAGNLADYLAIIEESPPMAVEEWSALGRARADSASLLQRAMAILPHHPGPLLYLLRLDPLPEGLFPRMLASARAEWVAGALELTVADGLTHPALIPIAEHGVRLGGRALATATAWITASKLGRTLLVRLGDVVRAQQTTNRSVTDQLWIGRRAPSPDRALERGRRGAEPDPIDSAALVRQLHGERIVELVNEVLREPREAMIEPVLHLLCAVNRDAAGEVMRLCDDPNPEVGERARQACEWPDVLWPSDSEPTLA